MAPTSPLQASPPQKRLPWRRSPGVAALLGWVLPGLGQVYAGRPGKGALLLLAILPTFLVGWALTGFTIVDRQHYELDFIAQAFLGGPTAAALHFGAGHVLDHMPRFFDVGRLYVQVAGLLNLVAICDAVGEAIRQGRRVDEMRAEREAAATQAAPEREETS